MGKLFSRQLSCMVYDLSGCRVFSHDFSNLLIIHPVKTQEITTVMVFGYLVLISIDFYHFTVYISIFSLVLVSIDKIYQTIKTAFDHISKQRKVHKNYSAVRHIFNSILVVWKCGQKGLTKFEISCHRSHIGVTPKTMKWWPCWHSKPFLWELNSFLM